MEKDLLLRVLGSRDLKPYMNSLNKEKRFKENQILSGDWCIKHGHLNLILDKVKRNEPLMFTEQAPIFAAQNGDVKSLQWLLDNDCFLLNDEELFIACCCSKESLDWCMNNVEFQTIQRLRDHLNGGEKINLDSRNEDSNKDTKILATILNNCLNKNLEEVFFSLVQILGMSKENIVIINFEETGIDLSFIKRLRNENLCDVSSSNVFNATIHPESSEETLRSVLDYIAQMEDSKNTVFRHNLPNKLIDIIFDYGYSPITEAEDDEGNDVLDYQFYWINKDTTIERFVEVIDRFNITNEGFLRQCILEVGLDCNLNLFTQLIDRYSDIVHETFLNELIRLAINTSVLEVLDWAIKNKDAKSILIKEIKASRKFSADITKWIGENLPDMDLNISIGSIIRSGSVPLLRKYLKTKSLTTIPIFIRSDEKFLELFIENEKITSKELSPLELRGFSHLLINCIKLKRKDLFNTMVDRLKKASESGKLTFTKIIFPKENMELTRVFIEEGLININVLRNIKRKLPEQALEPFFEIYKNKGFKLQMRVVETLKEHKYTESLYKIALGRTGLSNKAVEEAVKMVKELQDENMITLSKKLD